MVSEEPIQTQDELIGRLRELGYCVTQATVSRDIRQLKLTKVMTADGTYRYQPKGRPIRIYNRLDVRLMFADMIAKLRLAAQ